MTTVVSIAAVADDGWCARLQRRENSLAILFSNPRRRINDRAKKTETTADSVCGFFDVSPALVVGGFPARTVSPTDRFPAATKISRVSPHI